MGIPMSINHVADEDQSWSLGSITVYKYERENKWLKLRARLSASMAVATAALYCCTLALFEPRTRACHLTNLVFRSKLFANTPLRLLKSFDSGGSRSPILFSVLDEEQQQEEEFSFTEPENRLIEALIGIQGRGRSASPKQIEVCCLVVLIVYWAYVMETVSFPNRGCFVTILVGELTASVTMSSEQ